MERPKKTSFYSLELSLLRVPKFVDLVAHDIEIFDGERENIVSVVKN